MNRSNNSPFFSPNIYFWHERCLLAIIFYAYFFRAFFKLISNSPLTPHSLYHCIFHDCPDCFLLSHKSSVFRPTVNILYILHVCVSSYGRRVVLLVDCRYYRWFLTVEGHPILSMWLITSQQCHFHSFPPKIEKGRLKLTVYYKK
jgi:hypothetical protein